MAANIFKMAAGIVNFYSLLCFVRIIITWFPGAAYSGIGRFLSAVCDPFLNVFRKVKWMRLGMVDFSPMIAIAILTALSTILGNIAMTGRISISGIIALGVSIAWSIISSIGTFLLIVLLVRYLVMIFSKNSNYYGSIWSQMDSALSPLVFRMTSFLTGGKTANYRNALLLAIIMLVVIIFGGRFLIAYLVGLIQRLPF